MKGTQGMDVRGATFYRPRVCALVLALVFVLGAGGLRAAAAEEDDDEEVIEPRAGAWLLAETVARTAGRVASRVETRRTYDPDGNVLREVATHRDAGGQVASVHTLTSVYDDVGMLTKLVTRIEGGEADFLSVETWSYDDGYIPIDVSRSTDWDGDGVFDSVARESYLYDAWGYLRESTYESIESGYRSFDRTRYVYDANGTLVLEQTDSDTDGDDLFDTESFTTCACDEQGRLVRQDTYGSDGTRALRILLRNGRGDVALDARWRLAKTGEEKTVTIRQVHDGRGNRLRLDRHVEIRKATGECERTLETVLRRYDDVDRLVEEVVLVDADADGHRDATRTRRLAWDARGDLTADVLLVDEDADGTAERTTQVEAVYDATGALLERRDRLDEDGDGAPETTRTTVYSR